MIGIYGENLDNREKYSIEMALSTLGYPYRFVDNVCASDVSILINYGDYEPGDADSYGAVISIVRNDSIACEDNLVIGDDEILVGYVSEEYKAGNITMPFKNGKGAVVEEGKLYYINFDLFRNIFFNISCSEEFNNKKRDNHGRFLGEYSKRKETIHIPVVDVLINILDSTIMGAAESHRIPVLRKTIWPGNKNMAVFLSHDVDRIYERERYNLLSHLKKGVKYILKFKIGSSIDEFFYTIKVMAGKKNKFDDFSVFMDIEKSIGGTSSFYFIGDSRRTRYGARYRIGRLKKYFDMVLKNNCEVGLHGGYYSYGNTEMLSKEKENVENILEGKVVGIRQHYLMFKNPDTWKSVQDTGMKYDATLGYADMAGYRAGTGLPYHPYNMQDGSVFKILELPLVVMDGAVFEHGSLGYDDIIANIKRMVDRTEKLNSCISLLWHVSVSEEFNFPGWAKVYEIMLKYVHDKYDAFIGSGEEIFRWWDDRENIEFQQFSKEKDTCEYRFIYRGKNKTTMYFEKNNAKVEVSGAAGYSVKGNIVEVNIESGKTFSITLC